MKHSLTLGRTVAGIVNNRCPRCLKGPVFSSFFSMYPRCPECKYLYEREPGYFLGATIAAYFLGAFSVIPTLVISIFIAQLEIGQAVGISIAQILILTPLLFRFSRLIWLYVERRMTLSFDGDSIDHKSDG